MALKHKFVSEMADKPISGRVVVFSDNYPDGVVWMDKLSITIL